MSRVRMLANDSNGAISILFAASLVLLLAGAGLGFDAAKIYNANEALQDAVDGAALAAGADDTADTQKMYRLAKSYLNTNKPAPSLVTVGALTTSFDPASKTISAKLTGTVATSFMGIVGVPSVTITAVTQVKRSEPGPLDLVLALDTTSSMADSVGGTRKIDTLVAASKALVNNIMASPNARVGVVPFSSWVRVAASYKDVPWLALPTGIYADVCTVIEPPSGCTSST